MAQVGHLSASTDGAPISITATSTPGTTVHTAVAATDQQDMVHLYLANNHSASVVVTVEWGSATAALNNTFTLLPDTGWTRITPEGGLPIQNSKTVAIFAATTAVIAAIGKVIRSTASEAFN